jgi:hypothetical protein
MGLEILNIVVTEFAMACHVDVSEEPSFAELELLRIKDMK